MQNSSRESMLDLPSQFQVGLKSDFEKQPRSTYVQCLGFRFSSELIYVQSAHSIPHMPKKLRPTTQEVQFAGEAALGTEISLIRRK